MALDASKSFRSLIDEDSDNFLVSKLSALLGQKMSTFETDTTWTENLNDIQIDKSWTDLMNQLLSELHELGFTEKQMDAIWAQIPFNEDMIKALHIAKAANADIMIISDANTIAISRILTHYQINNLFTKIITNPAQWSDEGKLVVDRLVPKETPHGCRTMAEGYGRTCCANMCKGQEITRMIQEKYAKVVYVGDGANDFCPITRLRANDIALVRRNRVLSNILETPSSRAQIQANIIFWSEAVDVLSTYQGLFQPLSQEPDLAAKLAISY
ncbi:hypothetical protein K493DRAFT_334579 [Basidiobolus meristosporus CBS 931.73]|uniref:Uncharacterized protein n=1 Tax=Basidiobolus meristosporus CBS 931.73 TaxID=1314790 RepID=A0A1Y1YYK1_9FUNG|nr:hypothetical protein K493DRAFT_334579 [Basidiobolus meristosporus CBS 931.73]|eukprot:ORY02645.1 hypothetical protein K493DRAFT_334579 [Basidiobolus meristosporus CBS 931.73]